MHLAHVRRLRIDIASIRLLLLIYREERERLFKKREVGRSQLFNVCNLLLHVGLASMSFKSLLIAFTRFSSVHSHRDFHLDDLDVHDCLDCRDCCSDSGSDFDLASCSEV